MDKVKVKVSANYRVVIPKALREKLKIQPGQELLAYVYEGTIHLDPSHSMNDLRGLAKGMRWKPTDRDRGGRF